MQFITELCELRQKVLQDADDSRANEFKREFLEYVVAQTDSIQNEFRRKVQAAPKAQQVWVQRTFKPTETQGMCRVFGSTGHTEALLKAVRAAHPYATITLKDTPNHKKGECTPVEIKHTNNSKYSLLSHTVLITFTIHLPPSQ